MTTIKEKADAEAAKAEAEFPDEPEAEPAEPQGEPEQDDEEAEEEEKPQAKGRKKAEPHPGKMIDDAMNALARALKAATGVEELDPLPIPGMVGFMLPGFAEPRTHDNYVKCETCNGRGEVLTRANTGKHENDWHVCPDTRCKGMGYWTKAGAVTAAPQTGPLAVPPVADQNGEYAEAPTWLGDPSLTPTT